MRPSRPKRAPLRLSARSGKDIFTDVGVPTNPCCEEVPMRASVVRPLLIVCTIMTILAMPLIGYAQEAIVSGAITDSTGGVLPGVAVKAENEASGNTFEAVTDGRRGSSMP